MATLNNSGVVFNYNEHNYTLNGKQLSGITKTIGKYIVPDKYASVPEHILQAAAERGENIHSACSLYAHTGIADTQESMNFKLLLDEYGLTIQQPEYLVTDFENFATKIDQVTTDLSLIEIKTTASFDKKYVQWQLSIGAYLFELTNTELKANKLYGFWLRGDKAKVYEFERIDTEVIKELLHASANDLPFDLDKQEDSEQLTQLYDLMLQKAVIEAEIDKIKELIMPIAEKQGGLDTDFVKVSYIAESTRESFNSKAFKQEQAELYSKYLTTSTVKPSLRISLKQ